MSASQGETDLLEDERAGLELVRETGGIHQSDFWKELDVSSWKGSRLVEALESAELIEREEAVYAGQRTYYLEPTARDLDFLLLMVGDMLSPFVHLL